MTVFWLVVIVGVALLLYAISAERRNPPMVRCQPCCGEGKLPIGLHGVSVLCAACGGRGWIEVTR